MHAPVRTSAPAALPVSLAEAKAHLRVDHDDDDALIAGLIQAATDHLDGWSGVLGRCLVTQTWRQDFDAFASCLPLPLGPVSAIASVTYRNTAGQLATVDSSDYSLRTDAGGRTYVRFQDDFSTPGDLYEVAALSITYTAGYETVPAPIKTAILLMVGNIYECREATTVGPRIELPLGAQALLAPYRHVGI